MHTHRHTHTHYAPTCTHTKHPPTHTHTHTHTHTIHPHAHTHTHTHKIGVQGKRARRGAVRAAAPNRSQPNPRDECLGFEGSSTCAVWTVCSSPLWWIECPNQSNYCTCVSILFSNASTRQVPYFLWPYALENLHTFCFIKIIFIDARLAFIVWTTTCKFDLIEFVFIQAIARSK